MSQLEERVRSLSPEKRLLLEARLMGKREPARSAISRPVEMEHTPLSFGQESLWLFDQLDFNRQAYNLPQAFQIGGPLQFEPLRKALETIVARHEALRTNIRLADGAPMQVVSEPASFALPMIDLSPLPSAQREQTASRHLETEGQRPFDLQNDLLLRASLLKLGAEEHILFLCAHHIACDDVSLKLLHRELSIFYDNFCAGKPSPLPVPEFQYRDFARRQREQFHSRAMAGQIAYWKERLAGELPCVELPGDHPRARQTFRGNCETFQFLPGLLPELRELSRREKVTVHVVALAVFQILLQRYTRQDDLIVGTPISTRHQRETQNLIGFFVNTVPLRGDLSGNPTFLELMRQVHRHMLGALANQEIFPEQLVRELKLPRQAGANPLFQTIFQFLATPAESLALSGLSVEFIHVNTRASHFDLALTLRGDGEFFSAEADYNADLFEAATIRRLMGRYQNLLESAVTNPEQKIGDLRLLTRAEEQQILSGFNSTTVSPAKPVFVHQLFETQAARVPDAVAVRCGDRTWSYSELNERANQLAHFLGKNGIGHETPIAVCFERSPEMILAVFALLKCGAAYVPLDPGYPGERLAFMLNETKAAFVLTTRRLAQNLPRHCGKNICIDSDWGIIGRETTENPKIEISPDALAYIIFTSGSTGRPKGVQVTHGNLAHSTGARLDYYTEPVQNYLLTFSLAFDASVAGIFWPLCSGGTLTICEDGSQQDPVEMIRLIQRARVSHVIFLPSVYELILENAAPDELCSLKTAVVAGEASEMSLVKKHARQLPDVWLFNEYGPTEGTVWCTVEKLHPNRIDKVTIGKPIRNAQVYILDPNRNLVPIGVPGELCIGGAGVARGYLNNAELMREKFFPDPFSSDKEARLYRTGDLARFLPDGKIEFRGRIDDQVKVRGYRIELGEIEAALRLHPAIRESAVIAREDASGQQSLVAYVVASQPAPKSSELRAFLKINLPDYMVPSAFVVMEKLPSHPNGKINRKALPAPDIEPEAENFVAPRTPVERQIAQIWTDLLKIKFVGVHDNFFDLGGHSLLATQVVSRIRSIHPGAPSLRDFFKSPTIAGLSVILENSSKTGPALPGIVPLPRKSSDLRAH